MDTAWDVELPLSSNLGEEHIGPVVKYFITRIVEGVYGKDSLYSFFNTLVATKYHLITRGTEERRN
jgi:hypothetical protein